MNHMQRGITLIDLLVTVSIIAIVAGVAAPSISTMVERSNINEVLQRLRADVDFARSEAIRRNQDVYLSFRTGAGSCWGVNEGAVCNCAAANDCQVDAGGVPRTRQVSLANIGGLQFDNANTTIPAITGRVSLRFSPRGTVASVGHIEVDSANMNGRVLVNPIGRARLCSDALSSLPPTANCN